MISLWSTPYALAVRVLADDTPKNTGPDFGKASPFGLVIVILLFIGTVFLVWSMNKQLKKLPDSFDPEHPEPDQAVDDGTVDVDPAETHSESGAAPNAGPREPSD